MMTTIEPGQRYSRPDGASVRVDDVSDGQIYFVSWGPGHDLGRPARMTVSEFLHGILEERMRPRGCTPKETP